MNNQVHYLAGLPTERNLLYHRPSQLYWKEAMVFHCLHSGGNCILRKYLSAWPKFSLSPSTTYKDSLRDHRRRVRNRKDCLAVVAVRTMDIWIPFSFDLLVLSGSALARSHIYHFHLIKEQLTLWLGGSDDTQFTMNSSGCFVKGSPHQ